MAYVISREVCIGCPDCTDACNFNAVKHENEVYWIDDELCTDCGSCADVCPVDAISAS